MITLKAVGGVRIFGDSAKAWENPDDSFIKGYRAEFDSAVSSPDVDKGNFILPAHRGQYDYQIHLLEDGSALVIKEGSVYLCVCIDNTPHVLNFSADPSDQELARSI